MSRRPRRSPLLSRSGTRPRPISKRCGGPGGGASGRRSPAAPCWAVRSPPPITAPIITATRRPIMVPPLITVPPLTTRRQSMPSRPSKARLATACAGIAPMIRRPVLSSAMTACGIRVHEPVGVALPSLLRQRDELGFTGYRAEPAGLPFLLGLLDPLAARGHEIPPDIARSFHRGAAEQHQSGEA